MKLPSSLRPRPLPRGVALVIVLAMLVLLSALLVAFLTMATTERTSSFAATGVANSRQIADSTVSYVISQIRDATSVADRDTAWASQPGAIRTFAGKLNGIPKSGTLRDGAYWDDYVPSTAVVDGGRPAEAVYKLYSSDKMLVSAADYTNQDLDASLNTSDTYVVERWSATKPADNTKNFPDYVDLNQPVLSVRRDVKEDGTIVDPRYPIIDPRAKLKATDDTEGNPGLVDGFDAAISFEDKTKLDMVSLKDPTKPSGRGVPYLPMPVKWLYVLRDGTMGPASLATDKNPIVGRTAFWTDDESCKLNVNTASEGTFWDTPTASSTQECGPWTTGGQIGATPSGLNLGASMPIRGEFQRYPGHPATTSLSPVLGWIWGLSSAAGPTATPVGSYTNGVNAPYLAFKEAMYRLSPYAPFGLGTSQGGTRNTDYEADSDGKLKIQTKHLYTSVDDMIFRSGRFLTTNGNPDVNLIDPTKTSSPTNMIPPEGLERLRFFLTANSRAPELNLFSRPRVTIWPVNGNPKYRTAFDDLFIFTSTLAKATGANAADKRYCFLRYDAKDANKDFAGLAGDVRNAELYIYLKDMTTAKVPGFGRSFMDTTKWGLAKGAVAERDEILLLIMDYIRTVNLVDTGTTTRQTTAGTNDVFAPYTPKYFYRPIPNTKDSQYTRYDRSYDWAAQVTPLRTIQPPDLDHMEGSDPPPPFQGFGRFPILSEAAVVFTGAKPPPGTPPANKSKWMRAVLVLEMAQVMGGYPALRETFWTRVISRNRDTKVKVGDAGYVNVNFCGDSVLGTPLINVNNVGSHETAQGRSYMPTLGITAWMYRYPEHNKPTLTDPTSLENPQTDPNRVGNIVDPVPKIFENIPLTWNKDALTGRPGKAYKRAPGGGTSTPGTGTISFYPYVSREIEVKPLPEKQTFSFILGDYDLEIYVGEAPDDPRSRLVQTVHLSFPNKPVPKDTQLAIPLTQELNDPSRLSAGIDGGANAIINGDVVRSLELVCWPKARQNDSDPMISPPQGGDLRLAAALTDVPYNFYLPRDGMARYESTVPMIHGLCRGHGDPEDNFTGGPAVGTFVPNGTNRGDKPPILPVSVKGVQRIDGGQGDFDRGLSKHMDGAMANKVDEGNIKYDYIGNSDYTAMPYYRGRGIEETGQTFFTPNRQLPSPVMFGSIPTGIVRGKPWETLLFRPSRETPMHPGADAQQGPPDHLLLDLFHMPVVEPYAISEPFSTAGKVNMNYVIAPFGYAKGAAGTDPESKQPRSYIKRDTGMRGVLKSTYVMEIPTGQGDGAHTENPQQQGTTFRYPIDLNRTLEEFEARFKYKTGQYPLFRSASEICTVDLYPKAFTANPVPASAMPDGSAAGWERVWKNNALTGDNMRERPYAHIYPRLTTKSNVYTVHMRCQSIRKAANSKVDEFDPKLDSVVGEYRGSATIERFIDPNDPELAKYNDRADKVDMYYRYRVVNTKVFMPK